MAGIVFLLIILLWPCSPFDLDMVVCEAVPLDNGDEFKSLEIGTTELGPSTDFSPSPMRRNCCLFLALVDRGFLVVSLFPVESDGCIEIEGGGYCSVIGLDPIEGNLVLEEKELLADKEEQGDGVVGKELFIETIPESTEYFSFP